MGLLHRLSAEKPSRHRFAAGLAGHEAALRAMSGDALYNVQVHLLFQALDTVDEIAGPVTAGRIADALAARWADAPARVAEANRAAAMFTVNLSAPELAALMARERTDEASVSG